MLSKDRVSSDGSQMVNPAERFVTAMEERRQEELLNVIDGGAAPADGCSSFFKLAALEKAH